MTKRIEDMSAYIWKGFYKKTLKERQALVAQQYPNLFSQVESSSSSSMMGDDLDDLDCTGNNNSHKSVSNGIVSKRASTVSNSNSDEEFEKSSVVEESQYSASPAHSSASVARSSSSSSSLSGNSFYQEFPLSTVDVQILEKMIENCVGVLGLPLGLSFHLIMNGQRFVVPMAIEEPSVVAALSFSFKTLCHDDSSGPLNPVPIDGTLPESIGMEAFCSFERNVIDGQILIKCHQEDIASDVQALLLSEMDNILQQAQSKCRPNLIKRGGGVVGGKVKVLSADKVTLTITVDVQESMGANTVNDMLEGLKPYINYMVSSKYNAHVMICILSNFAPNRLVTARFKVDVANVAYKSFSGLEAAQRIIDANEWAKLDIQRAVTHNKGIMNGIDAVAVACGQDWRALEAGIHAYASTIVSLTSDVNSKQQQYRCLTEYRLITDSHSGKQYLEGEITLPLQVGVVGGAITSNPAHKYCLGLMNNPDCKTFAQILACVGLAQNFGALRALVTEGIQRGHMAMHARNIALSAGSLPDLVDAVAQQMIANNTINQDCAKEYLKQLKKQSNQAQNGHKLNLQQQVFDRNEHSLLNGDSPSSGRLQTNGRQCENSSQGSQSSFVSLEGNVNLK
ncbi:hypothetical protein MP228_007521 [Amoeboaphelidium protococcarum]|nr:hypothetical protein MP228_007521 [Amoeboaphelidium protococcarum]